MHKNSFSLDNRCDQHTVYLNICICNITYLWCHFLTEHIWSPHNYCLTFHVLKTNFFWSPPLFYTNRHPWTEPASFTLRHNYRLTSRVKLKVFFIGLKELMTGALYVLLWRYYDKNLLQTQPFEASAKKLCSTVATQMKQ